MEELQQAAPDSLVKAEEKVEQDVKPDPEGPSGTTKPEANGTLGTSAAARAAAGLSSAAVKALPDALLALFKHNSTNSLATIR